jgi:hypothetical protein
LQQINRLNMQKHISRKRFFALATLGWAALLDACKPAQKADADKAAATLPAGKAPTPAAAVPASGVPARPAALAPELVREFVGKAHVDLERVKELYRQEPGLLNAVWDWGGGDFESALEAAGHMGRRDIAAFLLENGARINMFCAAMLGELDIVKTTLTKFPHLKDSKGPHGLTLRFHAEKGGEQAKAVLAYLKEIGAG